MTTTNRLVLTLFVPAISAAAGCASSASVAPEAPMDPSSDGYGIAAAVSAAVPAVASATLAEARIRPPAADVGAVALDVPEASVTSSGADRYRPIAEGYISSTAFQRRFTNGLLAVTDIEPPVDPEDVKDLQKVIELIGAGEEEKALQLIAKKTTKVSSALLPFLEGQVHYQADPVRHEQAIAAFERALDEFEGYPRFQRAWFNLALCHYDLEQWDKAARALKQSVTLGRVDSLTYGLLGGCLLRAGDYEGAETAFRSAMMLADEGLQWRLALGDSLMGQERWTEAYRIFAGAAENDPGNALHWRKMGRCQSGLQDFEKAAECFAIMTRLGEADEGVLNLLADIYSNQGQVELAVEHYLQALDGFASASPGRALTSLEKMIRRGELGPAKELMEGIERLRADGLSDQERHRLRMAKIKVSVREGDLATNIETLGQIVAENPMDGDALILLAQALAEAERLEEALLRYGTAAQITGFEAKATKLHGELLVSRKRYAEAIPLLKASLQYESDEKVARFLELVEKAARQSAR
jgi:tetratricopeptide (TPR) repeat protein